MQTIQEFGSMLSANLDQRLVQVLEKIRIQVFEPTHPLFVISQNFQRFIISGLLDKQEFIDKVLKDIEQEIRKTETLFKG